MYGTRQNKRNRWINRFSLGLAVNLCLFLTVNCWGQASSSNLLPIRQDQIMVLKNGEILTGGIEQSADKLVIHTHQGSRLVIAKNKVDFICDSASEAFWGKSAKTRASDTRGQINLFRWCLKHQFLDQAESQREILIHCDVPAAQMDLLNRQLAQAQKMALTIKSGRQRDLSERQADLSQKIELPLKSTARIGNLVAGRNNEQPHLFKPLPSLNPDNAVATAEYKPTGPTLSTDGNVLPASFNTPVTPNPHTPKSVRPDPAIQRPHNSTRPTFVRPGLSTAGPIPDLSRSRRLTVQPPKSIDPYDATAFNAETAKRQN